MAFPFSLATGAPPRGRYLCDLTQVRDEFVASPWAAPSTTRPEIWDHFEKTTELFRDIDPNLPTSVWIGGSFTTCTVDPDDIDVTYLLDGVVHAALSKAQQHKVARLTARDGGMSRLRTKFGFRVDCFALVCTLVPMPWTGTTAEEDAYFRVRGMWDDFWLRSRSGAKTNPVSERDALPVRGYIEVLL